MDVVCWALPRTVKSTAATVTTGRFSPAILNAHMPETYRTLDRTEAALGKPVRTHQHLPRVGPMPVLLCSTAALLLWWKTLDAPRLGLAAAIMTGLAAIAGVGFAFDQARRRLWSAVTVHERGLVLQRPTGARVLGWEDLGSLEFRRQKRLRPESSGFIPLPGLVVLTTATEWHWVCRVRVDRHVALELSDRFDGSNELVALLREKTLALHRPRILEEIRDHGRVAIGPVAITETHFEVRGTLIPWSEIADVSIEGASLRVTDHDDVERARVLVENVPDVHVVMALADDLRSERNPSY